MAPRPMPRALGLIEIFLWSPILSLRERLIKGMLILSTRVLLGLCSPGFTQDKGEV